MIKFYILSFLLIHLSFASAQSFSFSNLIGLVNEPTHKSEAHVIKKDYKREFDVPSETGPLFTSRVKNKKAVEITRSISFRTMDDRQQIVYQTSDKAEYLVLLTDLRKEGFVSFASYQGNDRPSVYQKANYTITTSLEIRGGIVMYTFLVEKEIIPHPKEIVYAEDLLQYKSHAQLSAVFGEGAVIKDLFYYSEKETNKCTVLFPKTKREVIFIWDDEENYRKASFLIVGGHMETAQSKDFNRQIEQNLWQSEQGVYSGMSLKELQALNKAPINYYGWATERAGMLAPKNTGDIDFSRLGVVLNCLNCKESGYKTAGITSSEQELAMNKKVYVSTLIILPQKGESATASR